MTLFSLKSNKNLFLLLSFYILYLINNKCFLAQINLKQFHNNHICDHESNCLNGVCLSNLICKCNKNFVNLINYKSEGYCTHKLKKQYIAFFLEFFFILGFGHLYIGNILYFVIKITVFVLFVLCSLSAKFCFIYKSLEIKRYVYLLTYIVNYILFVWHVADITLFGLNMYKDNKGYKLIT